MDFLKAPTISRTHNGVVVESASRRMPKQAQDTFDYAVSSMSFFIPLGQFSTGAHWIAQITKTYDIKTPQIAACIKVIQEAMLTSQFADDYVAVYENGQGTYRGTFKECKAASKLYTRQGDIGWRVLPTKDVSHYQLMEAQIATAKLRNTPLPLQHHCIQPYRINSDQPPSGTKAQAMNMLIPFTDRRNGAIWSQAQEDDITTQDYMLLALANDLGYASWVTASPPQPNTDTSPGTAFNTISDAQDVIASLDLFLKNMLSRGWDPESKVHFCRPAPSHGAVQTVRPWEAIIHPQLIGWEIPSCIIARRIQAIEQESSSNALRERNTLA